MGIPGHTAYAATKAALRSYARTWAAEFEGRGIRVHTLSLGVTDALILDSQASTPEEREALVNLYLSRSRWPTRSRHRVWVRYRAGQRAVSCKEGAFIVLNGRREYKLHETVAGFDASGFLS